MQLLRNMKKQFAGLLYNTGFLSSSDPKHPAANVNSGNLKLVKAVLCAGLYPNVAKIEQKRPDRWATEDDKWDIITVNKQLHYSNQVQYIWLCTVYCMNTITGSCTTLGYSSCWCKMYPIIIFMTISPLLAGLLSWSQKMAALVSIPSQWTLMKHTLWTSFLSTTQKLRALRSTSTMPPWFLPSLYCSLGETSLFRGMRGKRQLQWTNGLSSKHQRALLS